MLYTLTTAGGAPDFSAVTITEERPMLTHTPGQIFDPYSASATVGGHMLFRRELMTGTTAVIRSFGVNRRLHDTPWLDRAQKRLATLLDLDDNWDGEGSPAPSKESFAIAAFALDKLYEVQVPPTSIAASLEGGIIISLSTRGRLAVLTIYNDDVITTTMSGRGAREYDTTSEDVENALKELIEFTTVRLASRCGSATENTGMS